MHLEIVMWFCHRNHRSDICCWAANRFPWICLQFLFFDILPSKTSSLPCTLSLLLPAYLHQTHENPPQRHSMKLASRPNRMSVKSESSLPPESWLVASPAFCRLETNTFLAEKGPASGWVSTEWMFTFMPRFIPNLCSAFVFLKK